jgi:hypothetical protein
MLFAGNGILIGSTVMPRDRAPQTAHALVAIARSIGVDGIKHCHTTDARPRTGAAFLSAQMTIACRCSAVASMASYMIPLPS